MAECDEARAGAVNAALHAAALLATTDAAVALRLDAFRREQTEAVLSDPDPRVDA